MEWRLDASGSIKILTPNVFGANRKYNVDCHNDGTFEQMNVNADSFTCDYLGSGKYIIVLTGQIPHLQINCENNENSNVTFLGVKQWGTNPWLNMEEMFEHCKVNFSVGTDSPNLYLVKSMSFMFHGARAFNQPLNHWNTSHVEDMSFMFADAKKFNGDIWRWDTSNVTSMSHMFIAATLFNNDISSWNVFNVDSCTNVFAGCNIDDGNKPNFINCYP